MFKSIFILFLLIFSFNCPAVAEEASRYEVEVAFVFKFIKFVKWPDVQADAGENFDLCYIGNGDIYTHFNKLEGYEVKKKKIKVSKSKKIENIKSCEILFVDLQNNNERKKYLGRLKKESILTISHHSGFIDEGGMINLFLSGNKVKFEINFIETKKSNLKVSSKLLKLAERIISE